MIKRITTVLALLFSVLYLPAWTTLAAVIFCFFYFRKFYEGLGLILLMDLLYGVAEPKFFNIQIFTFLVMAVVFFFIMFLKSKIKFYR